MSKPVRKGKGEPEPEPGKPVKKGKVDLPLSVYDFFKVPPPTEHRNVAPTSLTNWLLIQDDLAPKRFEVYATIACHGPITGNELVLIISRRINMVSTAVHSSYSPRIAELKRCGCIEAVGTKICSVTGKEVEALVYIPDVRPDLEALKRKVRRFWIVGNVACWSLSAAQTQSEIQGNDDGDAEIIPVKEIFDRGAK